MHYSLVPADQTMKKTRQVITMAAHQLAWWVALAASNYTRRAGSPEEPIHRRLVLVID